MVTLYSGHGDDDVPEGVGVNSEVVRGIVVPCERRFADPDGVAENEDDGDLGHDDHAVGDGVHEGLDDKDIIRLAGVQVAHTLAAVGEPLRLSKECSEHHCDSANHCKCEELVDMVECLHF
jgi:hypothetical protein